MARSKKELYMVKEGEEPAYLEMVSASDLNFYDARKPNPAELTIEAVSDALDRDAESSNAHDFVGSHKALAALMFKNLGRAQATKVVIELANFRGLHGLTGVAGCGDEDANRKAIGAEFFKESKWGT